MLDEPVGGNPRHHVVGVIDPFSPLIAQRERQGIGDFVWCSVAEFWLVEPGLPGRGLVERGLVGQGLVGGGW